MVESLIKKSKPVLHKLCKDLGLEFSEEDVKRTLAEKIAASPEAKNHPDLTEFFRDAEAVWEGIHNASYQKVEEPDPKGDEPKDKKKGPSLEELREECADRGLEFSEEDDEEALKKILDGKDQVMIEAAEIHDLHERAQKFQIAGHEDMNREDLEKAVNEKQAQYDAAQKELADRKAYLNAIVNGEIDIEYLNFLADCLITACITHDKQLIKDGKNGDRFRFVATAIERFKKNNLIK